MIFYPQPQQPSAHQGCVMTKPGHLDSGLPPGWQGPKHEFSSVPSQITHQQESKPEAKELGQQLGALNGLEISQGVIPLLGQTPTPVFTST